MHCTWCETVSNPFNHKHELYISDSTPLTSLLPTDMMQVFQRVPSDSPSTQDDARFDYFVGTVLPQILRAKQAHTAVFIPCYFDYVRVRNHLLKNKASVVSVHEYSRGSEVRTSDSKRT